MATNYANEKIATAIRNHLLDVDAVPPTAEASKLARELARICLTELNTAGLGSETVESLFAPPTLKAKARVRTKPKGNRRACGICARQLVFQYFANSLWGDGWEGATAVPQLGTKKVFQIA